MTPAQQNHEMASIVCAQTLDALRTELAEYRTLDGEARRISRGYVLRLIARFRHQEARRHEAWAAWMREARATRRRAA